MEAGVFGSTITFRRVETAALVACCNRAIDCENAARRASRYPYDLLRELDFARGNFVVYVLQFHDRVAGRRIYEGLAARGSVLYSDRAIQQT